LRVVNQLTFAFPAEFFEQLDLDLLDLKESIVLATQEVIDFFVQVPDFQLGLEIDFVIVLRAQPIASLGPVLTHHNDRRLDSGQTRENQIEKNERIWIEGFGGKQHDIRADPHEDDSTKADEKFPTAAEFGDAIGEALAKRKFLFELLLDIARNDFVLPQAFDDFLVERGEFSDLILEHFLDVFFAAIADVVEANESGAVPFRMVLLDAVEQGRPDHFGNLPVIGRFRLPADLANARFAHGDSMLNKGALARLVDSVLNARWRILD
jgi:hypothetical protein